MRILLGPMLTFLILLDQLLAFAKKTKQKKEHFSVIDYIWTLFKQTLFVCFFFIMVFQDTLNHIYQWGIGYYQGYKIFPFERKKGMYIWEKKET